MTKQTEKLVKGTLLLTIAGIVAKIFSAFYRIPLAYLVKDEGIGYFFTVYPMYALLTSAALVGIPNAVSKLVAEEVAIGAYKKAHKTFKDALVLTTLLGLIVSLVMFFGADFFIKIGDWPVGTKYSIWGFAIAPVFVSIIGATRGYFQGLNRMKPTAMTQIIENAVKLVVGISLVMILLGRGFSLPKAVGGAALGASLGVIIAALYMMIAYTVNNNELKKMCESDVSVLVKVKNIQIVKRIFSLAIPVTIVAAAYSVMNLIDSLTFYKEFEQIGLSILYAREEWGQIGKTFSVINVPLTISIALSVSIVPSISEAVAKNLPQELRSKINQGIKLAFLLALPAAAGLFVLAEPIIQLLYPTNPGGYEYLQIYSICLLFMILGQTLASILQGISKQYLPLFSLTAAIIVKVILNQLLISSSLEGRGAAIASVAYYVVFVIINVYAIKRSIQLEIYVIRTMFKPLFASIIMAFCLPLIYNGLYRLLGSNAVCTLLSVLFGFLVYFLTLLLTKSLTRDDLAFLPYQKKTIRLLEKLNLIQ